MNDHAALSNRQTTRYLVTLTAILVVYVGAAKFGLSLAFATRQVTALWPPTGIALASLLLFGYRVWPAIFLGALLVNATTNEPLVVAAGIAAGNTLGPLAGTFLLDRVAGFDRTVQRIRDAFNLVLFGGIIPMTVTATNGVANLALGGLVSWSDYGSVWWIWWIGDVMGVVVVAPLILTWAARRSLTWRGWRLLEGLVLFLAILFVSLVVLSAVVVDAPSRFEHKYALFPLLIWTGMRFGLRETTTGVALISGLAVWGTVQGLGPFAIGTLDERLVLLELFMAAVALTGLALGAATAERRHALDAIRRAHDELESRVQERTRELAAANKVLAEKNEEVEAFVYIVSHDLRAPLLNLQGFSKELDTSCGELEQALRGVELPPAVAQRVDSIQRDGIGGALRYISASAAKFQRLIDALLTLSRTGRQSYGSEDVDVREVVATTLDSLRQSIEVRGATISVTSMRRAKGDQTAIGQVFSNLVSNALAYLHPGRSGLIEIGSQPEDGMVHYWVRDNGSGIPPGAQRRLFQVFQRFHPAMAPGEGMGLAIVKRVVERHGGRVWADSTEGVGTTFHLTLPAAVTDEV